MATVSGASLGSGLAICLLYLFLPSRFVFVREELLYVCGEAAAVAAIVVGARWYKLRAAGAQPPADAPAETEPGGSLQREIAKAGT